MLRQSGGHGGCEPRSAPDADGPIRSAQPLGVELTDDPHHTVVEQTAVPAGDGLLRGPEDLGDPTERRSGVEIEGVDYSPV
jgi:hypothetical protein